MKQTRTVIRMGATEWSVTLPTKNGPTRFDLRSMAKDDRRKFHSAFMSAYRSVYYAKPATQKAA